MTASEGSPAERRQHSRIHYVLNDPQSLPRSGYHLTSPKYKLCLEELCVEVLLRGVQSRPISFGVNSRSAREPPCTPSLFSVS